MLWFYPVGPRLNGEKRVRISLPNKHKKTVTDHFFRPVKRVSLDKKAAKGQRAQ